MPQRCTLFIALAATFALWIMPQAVFANAEIHELHNPFGADWRVEFFGLVMDSTVQAEQEKRVEKEVQDCWDYVWGFLGDRYKLQGSCPIFERSDPGGPMHLSGTGMADPGAPMNMPEGLFSPPPPTFVESPMGMFEQPLKIDYDISNLTEKDLAVPDDAPGVAPEPTSPDQGMGPGGQMNQSF